MQLDELISVIRRSLEKGKDVEIRTCKDGYKVLEVTRKTETIVERSILEQK